MDQEKLVEKVIEQLGLVQPKEIRIGWGASWEGTHWVFDQSSGVLNPNGQLPFLGIQEGCHVWYDVSQKYTLFQY